MEKNEKTYDCFIGAIHNHLIDPFLEENGFTRGLVVFAIPELGVLFKCRVEGELIELEFAAFFSLLKFLSSSLAREKINNIRIFSSNPEFVFSFTGKGKHLGPDSPKLKILKQYTSYMKIAVCFIQQIKHRALLSPADYPSLPENHEVKLDFDFDEKRKFNIKPFQKGVIL
ncbi:MAG: hypothetical protein PHU88_06655 [candidate division Zixibacteria bacterium]|nr:hypothetical protein [candidate division Zixibacteria bacterium]